GKFGDLLKEGLENKGWTVAKQPLDNDSSRFNLLATRKPLDEVSPRLIFNTHLDTVPPYIPPTEDEENIYGRGSCDAKAQLACMVSAAQSLVESHPDVADQVGLLFVVGEEVDHVGMQKANDFKSLKPEYLVVGEPTELKFATIQKGALKVAIKCKGKAGHSGYPSEGESAIHKLIPVLNDILNYEWPSDDKSGATTINIGIIEGGHAQNAFAEFAQAKIFVRVTTSVAEDQKRLEKIVAGRAEIEHLSSNDPVALDGAPLDYATDQVAFNTDLSYYEGLSCLKGKYLFGAGTIKVAHSAREFVPKKELHACKDVLIALAVKLCSEKK
ncbi:unnamed protein product, partial [Cylicocyclus nassatus]